MLAYPLLCAFDALDEEYPMNISPPYLAGSLTTFHLSQTKLKCRQIYLRLQKILLFRALIALCGKPAPNLDVITSTAPPPAKKHLPADCMAVRRDPNTRVAVPTSP